MEKKKKGKGRRRRGRIWDPEGDWDDPQQIDTCIVCTVVTKGRDRGNTSGDFIVYIDT